MPEIDAAADKEINDAYIQGFKDGMKRFAWWKDGVEFVGTCGTTLKKAIEDLLEEMPCPR